MKLCEELLLSGGFYYLVLILEFDLLLLFETDRDLLFSFIFCVNYFLEGDRSLLFLCFAAVDF